MADSRRLENNRYLGKPYQLVVLPDRWKNMQVDCQIDRKRLFGSVKIEPLVRSQMSTY